MHVHSVMAGGINPGNHSQAAAVRTGVKTGASDGLVGKGHDERPGGARRRT